MPVEAMPRFHPVIKSGSWYVGDSHKGRGQAVIVSESFSTRAEALEASTKMNKEQNA